MNALILKDNVAVVTGASRGIGREIALQLAAKGAHIVALARTVGALEALDDDIKAVGGNATLVPFDLRRLSDIDSLGPNLLEKLGRCDILVGNAGILGDLTPVHQYKPARWEEVFKVNLFANQHLIGTLHPLLRAAPHGRAVFITSGAARSCNAYWGAYASSKAALEAMCQCYAKDISNTPIKVNVFDPGAVRTEMRATAYPGEDPLSLPDPKAIAAKLIPLCLPDLEETGARFTA